MELITDIVIILPKLLIFNKYKRKPVKASYLYELPSGPDDAESILAAR